MRDDSGSMTAAPGPRRVLALVPDLFFASRITTTATHLGVAVHATTPDRLVADCREIRPALIIIDLHAPGGALEAVRELKRDPVTAGVRVVGFYSHVEAHVRAAALEAGVDEPMPRSAFTAKLATLLAEH